MERDAAITRLTSSGANAISTLSSLEDSLHSEIVSCGQERKGEIEEADFNTNILTQAQEEHSSLESHHSDLHQNQADASVQAMAAMDSTQHTTRLNELEGEATTTISSQSQEFQQDLIETTQACSQSLTAEQDMLTGQLKQQATTIESELENCQITTQQLLINQATTEITDQNNEVSNAQQQLHTHTETERQALSMCAMEATKELHSCSEQCNDALSDTAKQEKEALKDTNTELINLLDQQEQKLENKLNNHTEHLKGDLETHGELLTEKMGNENHERKDKLTQDKDQFTAEQQDRKTELIDDTLSQKIQESITQIDTAFDEGEDLIKNACEAGKTELTATVENGQNTLNNDASSHIEEFSQHGNTLVGELQNQAKTTLGEINTAGQQAQSEVGSTVNDSFSIIQNAMQSICQSVQSTVESCQNNFAQEIESSFETLKSVGDEAQQSILSNATSSIQTLQDELVSSTDNLIQMATSAINRLISLGQSITPNFIAQTNNVEAMLNQLFEEKLSSIQSLVEAQLSKMQSDYQSRAREFIDKIKSSQQQLIKSVERSKKQLASEVRAASRKLIIFYNNAYVWGIQDGYSDGIMILNTAAECSDEMDSMEQEEVECEGADEELKNLENPHENWSCNPDLPDIKDLMQDFINGKRELNLKDLGCAFEEKATEVGERLNELHQKIKDGHWGVQFNASGTLPGGASGSLGFGIDEDLSTYTQVGSGVNTGPGIDLNVEIAWDKTKEGFYGSGNQVGASSGKYGLGVGGAVNIDDKGNVTGGSVSIGAGVSAPSVSAMQTETTREGFSFKEWFEFKDRINDTVQKMNNFSWND